MKKKIRTARFPAARLEACVQASGVKTKARSAHVDVERVTHGTLKIASNTVAIIAAKAHMPCGNT
jgi:hypothetical protein